LPQSAAQALTLPRKTGRLSDVEHVVILMQENRSFDHYYGTMRGVRGFSDRAALRLPSGKSVLYQPDTARTDGGALLPFHVDTTKVDGQDLGDLDHSWQPTHNAWDDGAYDAWIPNKSELTMGYFTDADIPFQRALSSAFTICDHYFCSIQGPTTPNRLYHWTGTIDAAGRFGGPINYNPADYLPVLSWPTYPERLQDAGISWQIFANKEVGDGNDGWVGDYGDNPLWLFHAYHDALASSDPKQQQLAARANVINQWLPDSGQGMNPQHVLADFIAACKTGNLPKVSWIVAPYRWCEHPAARPVDGAVYVSNVLKALWGNQKLWDNTALFVNFDENDGFFDHVVPPTAPAGTEDEYIYGLPIGLGPRVPMMVISPWSRGGWVNSQVFDHTSVLRFLEQWTGVKEPNISDWRRTICGDLTSAFDFSAWNPGIPLLPDAAKLQAKADQTQSKLPTPAPPAEGQQADPQQEPGFRLARPIPYQAVANATLAADASALTVHMANTGGNAIQLQVYPTGSAILRQDVPAHGTGQVDVPVSGAYDIAVHGPNRFLRTFAGNGKGAGVEVTVTIDGRCLKVAMSNGGSAAATVKLAGPHLGQSGTFHVGAGHTVTEEIDVVDLAQGWYDLTATVTGDAAFQRRFVGHVEYGNSISG
ncbi:MAG TPA: phospholipase C, phosphocholine-specific, partial [Pseudonocardiaceae bacterium]|nr:phospholipase C, phosphocholine-specific [Pseudonocardiaceae bacterium]